MNISAKIIEIFDTANVTETFRKREFVVEYSDNPQYPEYVKFELVQDKCSLLDKFKVGDEVEVHFNLRGRKWTDPQGVVKYFNSLQAWRLEAKSAGEQQAPEDAAAPPADEPEWLADNDEKTNDLPF